jgi:cold shock protein
LGGGIRPNLCQQARGLNPKEARDEVKVRDRLATRRPVDLREDHALFNVLVAEFALWCRRGDAKQAVRVGAIFVLQAWRILMSIGTVKWFNPTKGYGFIQPQGGGQDVFVHISAVERAGLSTLNEGQQVEYEVVSNRGKSSAENLKVK